MSRHIIPIPAFDLTPRISWKHTPEHALRRALPALFIRSAMTALLSLFRKPMHQVLDMDERVFFHLSEVLHDDNNNVATPAAGSGGSAPTDKDSGGDGVAATAPEVESAPSTAAGNGNTKPTPIIKRGQEVAFRIGQRQGKPLGLRVRKLRQGTLPTEESLPCRFVGVVVVAPRNVGTVDKEKVQKCTDIEVFRARKGTATSSPLAWCCINV